MAEWAPTSMHACLLGSDRSGVVRGSLDSDAVTGFGDPVPFFNLRWNMGVHNVMTYVTGNIPVGRYDPNRLANLGLGHQALDAGAGYTYFNPHTGWEFSSNARLHVQFRKQGHALQERRGRAP